MGGCGGGISRVHGADEGGFIRIVEEVCSGDIFADGGDVGRDAGEACAQAFDRGHAKAFVGREVDGDAACGGHELLQFLLGDTAVVNPACIRQGGVRRQSADDVDADGVCIGLLLQPGLHALDAQSGEFVRESGSEKEDVCAMRGQGAWLGIEPNADNAHVCLGCVGEVSAFVELGRSEHQVRRCQRPEGQGAEVGQFMGREGAVCRAAQAFVMLPDDIVQVAGQLCFAQAGKERGIPLGQDGPVRFDATNGGREPELVPEDAAKSPWDRAGELVQVYMIRAMLEGCGAFIVAQDVKFFDTGAGHQPSSQSHGYVENTYGFGGSKTLVGEGQQQLHVRSNLTYRVRCVKNK